METHNYPQSTDAEASPRWQHSNGSRRDRQTGHSDQPEGIPRQALKGFSVGELANCCSEETDRFLKQSESNDRFCLELFRRALIEHNEEAWVYLYDQYSPLVLTWVTQHQGIASTLGQDTGPSLVNAVFAKFAQALTPMKMENFDSLGGVLKYLKMCVGSVVADEVRSRQSHQQEEILEAMEQEPATDDFADDVVAYISAQDFWQTVQAVLDDEDERILVYLIYVQAMKPIEICKYYPRFFPTTDHVYRVKRNALERLRRNRHLHVMLK